MRSPTTEACTSVTLRSGWDGEPLFPVRPQEVGGPFARCGTRGCGKLRRVTGAVCYAVGGGCPGWSEWGEGGAAFARCAASSGAARPLETRQLGRGGHTAAHMLRARRGGRARGAWWRGAGDGDARSVSTPAPDTPGAGATYLKRPLRRGVCGKEMVGQAGYAGWRKSRGIETRRETQYSLLIRRGDGQRVTAISMGCALGEDCVTTVRGCGLPTAVNRP